MKRLRTLRARFALWVAALLLAVLVAFGALVYFSLARDLSAAIDDSLQLSASQAIAAVNIENGQINFADSIPENPTVTTTGERDLTIRIFNPGGQIIQASGEFSAWPATAASITAARQQRSTFETLADPKEQILVRFYTGPIIENGQLIGIVQVAQDLEDVQKTLNRLLQALLIGGPLLVLVAAFGGYFLAARALAPIDQIIHTARRISAEDLSARLNLPATDDEVGRLATTFDAMLARLDESFKRERQFTADASHELRTPLAAMQAILGVIREERRTPEDYEQALSDISEEADRLRALTEDLLQLARGDTQSPAAYAKIDLSALLNDVADSLRPLAEAKGLALNCNIPNGLFLSGEMDGLIRLFVNLVENAVKYTDDGAITLSAQAEADQLRIIVADTGPGIPPEHLPRIFDRFYRVDASRTQRGAGLGLAIALDIARAHGGAIEVSSTLGAGSAFTVQLPGLR
ncbi:MAG: HAMP domain-containing protein [Chloroflexi bacterium]|nr:HAMP domain-containing protein [Chloroflexota bacterium]